jgi:hypothetical protein
MRSILLGALAACGASTSRTITAASTVLARMPLRSIEVEPVSFAIEPEPGYNVPVDRSTRDAAARIAVAARAGLATRGYRATIGSAPRESRDEIVRALERYGETIEQLDRARESARLEDFGTDATARAALDSYRATLDEQRPQTIAVPARDGDATLYIAGDAYLTCPRPGVGEKIAAGLIASAFAVGMAALVSVDSGAMDAVVIRPRGEDWPEGEPAVFLDLTLVDNHTRLVLWHARDRFGIDVRKLDDLDHAVRSMLASLPRQPA